MTNEQYREFRKAEEAKMAERRRTGVLVPKEVLESIACDVPVAGNAWREEGGCAARPPTGG